MVDAEICQNWRSLTDGQFKIIICEKINLKIFTELYVLLNHKIIL